jgi:hypothetical protein
MPSLSPLPFLPRHQHFSLIPSLSPLPSLPIHQHFSLIPSLSPLPSLPIHQHFSQDMQHVVTTLLSGKAAASQVCHLISERINEEFDSAMAASDALHRLVLLSY